MSRLRYLTVLFCLFSLFALTQPSKAQLSLYGTAAATNFCLSSHNVTSCKKDGGGLIGGTYYNFPIHSRFTAGIDARGSYSFGSSGGTSAAAAFRIGFVPERSPFRPYFQLGGAVFSSTFTTAQTTGPAALTRYTNGAIEFAGGLDIRLTDSFDLRAIELGAGASGSSSTTGGAFLDAGVVYHLHKHVPKS